MMKRLSPSEQLNEIVAIEDWLDEQNIVDLKRNRNNVRLEHATGVNTTLRLSEARDLYLANIVMIVPYMKSFTYIVYNNDSVIRDIVAYLESRGYVQEKERFEELFDKDKFQLEDERYNLRLSGTGLSCSVYVANVEVTILIDDSITVAFRQTRNVQQLTNQIQEMSQEDRNKMIYLMQRLEELHGTIYNKDIDIYDYLIWEDLLKE